MQEILQSYIRRLTNLSGNNRSLLLTQLPTDQFVDIHSFDQALHQPSFDIIKGILARKTKIPLCDVQDCRDQSANQLSVQLKKIQRTHRLGFEERGTRELYIGWPIVKGKFSDGTLVRCPLLFFPVALVSSDHQWQLNSRREVNVAMNKSFLLAYAHFNAMHPNEQLLDRCFDDFDNESTGFCVDLYELLQSEKLIINFNRDNFTGQLTAFHTYTKSDLQASERDGELKLFPEAILGIFPQSGSSLVPDYLTLLEDSKLSSMENFFAERTFDDTPDGGFYSFLNKIREEQTFTPFPMDAYQENVIKAIKKGNSVVVQGPPGTGKSQLICNLVADYIARGKNVLVVSQKRAALDVVFERLKGKALHDFIGLLHDFKSDRKSIYEQIAGQIARLDYYQSQNNSLDAIRLERNFLKTSRRIDQIEEVLDEYKKALFDTSESGVSVKELYLTSSPHCDTIPLNFEYYKFDLDYIEEFKRKLKSYTHHASTVLNTNHAWHQRKSFADFQVTDLQMMIKHLGEVAPYIKVLETDTEKIIGKKLQFEDAIEIIQKQDEIAHILEILRDEEVYPMLVRLLKNLHQPVAKDWLVDIEQRVLSSFDQVHPELSLASDELGRFQEALRRSIAARSNPVTWLKWKLFSKDKIFITRVLVNNNLKNIPESFHLLVKKMDSRLNLEHNISQLRAHDAVSSLPNQWRKIELKNWFFYQKQAVEAQIILNGIRHMNEYMSPTSDSYTTYTQHLSKLLEALQPIGDKLEQWQTYFSAPQLRQIFVRQIDPSKLVVSLKKDFEALCTLDSIVQHLSQEEAKIIEKLKEALPRISFAAWWKLFDNSLKIAWIHHIELKYPLLRSVSSNQLEALQIELQECVKNKLEISKEILLLKARERVYNNVEYNRLNNRITYRALLHEVTKKRRIWPVRKAIAHYSTEVFDLIPCWLASPESVSAIFPMEKIFDLVIFDEASQCFVEQGIPAIYRGKQVVIAGDDKQLKPNSLYQVRWEESNDNENIVLDMESLLDLGNQHLMQVQLHEHYRSKKLDLIQFSNMYFYGNSLSILPDFEALNDNNTAIDYVKVEGCWMNNTNLAEAQRIATILHSLLKDRPSVSIGIVTFNAPQQLFIMDYLEEYASDHNCTWPESLVVKNIENIQGDEKDIIIFSTVYAPDLQGKMNMNFGNLNAQGGENRLNVAITRAREKIYLVTSILPHQLKVENSKNEGPKLLKKYLLYAQNISARKAKEHLKITSQQHADWYLSSKIANMDYTYFDNLTIDQSMPYVELAVKNRHGYLAVIMTDDELFNSDISAKASHVYRPFLLKQKKWNFVFVHSRQYWIDCSGMKEQLNRMITRAIHSNEEK